MTDRLAVLPGQRRRYPAFVCRNYTVIGRSLRRLNITSIPLTQGMLGGVGTHPTALLISLLLYDSKGEFEY